MDESYLVVSDLHLGAENCCKAEFENFLDWLARCSRNGDVLPVQTQQGTRQLTFPTTMILLGDMLELWVPHDHELSSVLCASASVFSKLIDLTCKKVYVLGNHDATLFEHSCETNGSTDRSFQTLLNWICTNNSDFEVVPRHYPNCPSDPREQRVRIGEKNYLFLHGQQFDRDFKTTGGLVRFVPFIAALASAFDFASWIGPLLFIVSLVFLALVHFAFDRPGVVFCAIRVHSIPRVFVVHSAALLACLGSQKNVDSRHRSFREVTRRRLRRPVGCQQAP
jgi:hypothetical protein